MLTGMLMSITQLNENEDSKTLEAAAQGRRLVVEHRPFRRARLTCPIRQRIENALRVVSQIVTVLFSLHPDPPIATLLVKPKQEK